MPLSYFAFGENNLAYTAKEQINCPIGSCGKPIDAGQMQRHLDIVHTPEHKEYIELGHKYGVKGRTKKKVIEERLW